ncbi:MAG: alpha/beta fold hydrolase [Candidatus Hodarchaeales archaeon]|jgi:pimeloyl-ACP methyl ester carboxylesterase
MPYFTRDDYQVFYEEIGEGSPVVFIHGYLGSSRSHWGHQLDDPNLSTKYHLIAPDLRGFAKSSLGKFVEKNKTIDLLEDIHYLLNKVLDLKNKPVLVGYSVGATLCIQYCLQNPGKVSGLVLLGPRPFFHKTTRAWNFLAKEKRTEEKKKSASSFTWSIVKRFQKGFTYLATVIQKRRQKDYLRQFEQIEVPILMIYSLTDTVTPQLVFKTMKMHLPEHTQYHIYEGDHGFANERTEEFNALIFDFFKKNLTSK